MDDVEGSAGVVSKEVRMFREKQMKLEREKKEKEEDLERWRRKKDDDEKREKRREQEREEREFKSKEKSWLEHEKIRDREKKRYYDDLKENQIKRKQAILLDDEDEKQHRKKIRSREAKRRREREREQDEQDRIREEKLIRKAEKEEEEKKKILMEQERIELEKENEKKEKLKGHFKAEESIPMLHPTIVTIQDERKSALPFSVSLSLGSAQKLKTTIPTSNSAIFSADGDGNDMTRKERKLMLLEHEVGNHTKEESPQVLDAKAKAQQVIDKIPTDKTDLFKFEIDWQVVDENNIVEDKMKGWVKKKIFDYLGEEEEQLIEFICKKLKDHTPPDSLLDLLLLVLEDEATDFVIRMWRMLIYNILMVVNQK